MHCEFILEHFAANNPAWSITTFELWAQACKGMCLSLSCRHYRGNVERLWEETWSFILSCGIYYIIADWGRQKELLCVPVSQKNHPNLMWHLSFTGFTGGATSFAVLSAKPKWWLTERCYSSCIYNITLHLQTPPPPLWKPVTSGDSASQPRPWYIDNPGPQPSCPAVLSFMLSLSTGAAGQ